MPTADLVSQYTLVNDLSPPDAARERADIAWASNITYQPGDVVVHEDFLWLCQRENSLNQTPGLAVISNALYSGNKRYDWVLVADIRPRFSGGRTKTGQSLPAGVSTKILLDTGNGNGNLQDAGNNGLKPYFRSAFIATAEVHIESGLTPGVGVIQVIVFRKRAGVTVTAFFEERPVTAASAHWGVSRVIDAFAGDEYTMHVYHSNGTTPSLSTLNASGLSFAGVPSYFI